MDSFLYEYFFGVVVETMVPVSSWAKACQEVAAMAIDVSTYLAH